MRLGIDFGTTRIVAAAVDRGNYPVLTFEAEDGQTFDWYPPLIALVGGERLYGWDAWTAQGDPQATVVRSIKSTLESAGPGTPVRIGDQSFPMMTLLSEMAAELKRAIEERSSAPQRAGDPLQAMLGVPANANSNQRFLTVEAFRRAGFDVLGMLNEPSAASIEFGHKNPSRHPDRILVYDFGGGTFDVSLVEMSERSHTVLASEGIPTLGGDDFDEVLANLALERTAIDILERESLTQAELFRLHEECRVKKESIHPNTRKISIDLECVREGWGSVTVPASEFLEHCRPLVQETLHATEDLLAGHGMEGENAPKIEALYVTGGGSELPLVGRMLREQFGRRVRRSAHARTATAIGLAIQADEQAGYVLREKFTRFFGVWREADAGQTIVFDPLFEKGAILPEPGGKPLLIERSYSPVHNIGHFRYLECSRTSLAGAPTGDITVWDEILFPFDPALASEADLVNRPVERSAAAPAQVIEECYACDASGTVEVRIANRTRSYERSYRLGRWAAKEAPIVPGRKRRAAAVRGAPVPDQGLLEKPMRRLLKPSLDWLLVFLLAAVFLHYFRPESHTLIFCTAGLAIIPLAGWIGHATEHLAEHTGEGVGGLLNATFGNAAELIIGLFALQRGLYTVVKASLTGSIIGNVLLVAGAAVLGGGLKYKCQQFNATGARSQASMLTLAAIALIVPAAYHYLAGTSAVANQQDLSFEIAIVLMLTYALSLVFTLHTHKQLFAGSRQPHDSPSPDDSGAWTLKRSMITLAVATAITAWASEILVGSVEAAAHSLGMTDIFVGVIVVAIVGNAAEHSTAVMAARANRMDLSLSIALGSSLQIALFVAPLLLFTSYLVGPQPMDLVFSPAEVLAVGVAVAIAGQIAGDGESNWLEGVQLLAVYAILGIVFYFMPEHGGAAAPQPAR